MVEIPAEAPPPPQHSHGARAHPARVRLPPASRSQGPAEDRCLLPGAPAAGQTERRARTRRRWRGSGLPVGGASGPWGERGDGKRRGEWVD